MLDALPGVNYEGNALNKLGIDMNFNIGSYGSG